MPNKYFGRTVAVLSLVAAFSIAPHPAGAGIIVSVDAPGVQTTAVVGATTETFDSGAASGVLGTYTNMLVLSPALYFGIYGGAFGTDYGAVFDGFAVLELGSPQKYFGMWWAAADADNTLWLYDDATLLIQLTTSDLLPFLPPAYFGNPNTGQNPAEPYFYLHFTTTGNSEITHVLFANGSDSFFESDNHSIVDQSIGPPGTVVVPEPSGLAAAVCVLGIVMATRRRNRTALKLCL